MATYLKDLYPPHDAERKLVGSRRQALAAVDNLLREQKDARSALGLALRDRPQLRDQIEPFLCHMLREAVGAENFFEIYETYADERLKSSTPISAKRFKEIAEHIYGKPLGWFWNQWLELDELPQLKLHDIHVSEVEKGWRVQGSLSQVSDSSFRLPVKLELRTNKRAERQTLWLEEKSVTFEFPVPGEPRQILVDPDLDILTIQDMPPLFWDMWKQYPNYAVVYGTAKEMKSNKATALQFCSDYLGLDEKIVMADVDVNDIDLKDKSVILFGRPECNRITKRFEDSFLIRFEGNTFSWHGSTYKKATQGVLEIVANPHDPQQLILLCAGVSGDATCSLGDPSFYLGPASYLIFDGSKELTDGHWMVDRGLIWTREQ
jgi:hypothetical protein